MGGRLQVGFSEYHYSLIESRRLICLASVFACRDGDQYYTCTLTVTALLTRYHQQDGSVLFFSRP